MLRRLLVLGMAVLLAGVAAVAAAEPGQDRHRARSTYPGAAVADRLAAAGKGRTVAVREAARSQRRAGAASVRPARHGGCRRSPPPVPEHPISHRQWLSGVTITEYYPAPERWFSGRRVRAPGLPGLHAVDWLYSAHGLAMEGDGVDLQGRPAYIAQLGSTGWVNGAGRPTVPVCLGQWSHGSPAWLSGGWRNRAGAVTFPLAGGGWSDGAGGRRRSYGGVTFAPGLPRPLRYYHSIAVDPRLIPFGSRVYIPAYRHIGGGWFEAQDTGGAIKGRHVDVYRSAPASPADLGRYLTRQRILVIPPAG